MTQRHQFYLKKMQANLKDPIDYQWRIDDETSLPLNDLMGRPIRLALTGKIRCLQCQRLIKKTFQQGYCFPCYRRLLECNLCIIHPERCIADASVCLKDDWAHAHCLQPHVVYLALTSHAKVGITRLSQLPTRWIDQGARLALPIMQTANRRQAGLVEVALKQHIADKTQWRQMLCDNRSFVDLAALRDKLMQLANDALQPLFAEHATLIKILAEKEMTSLRYPDAELTSPVKALNLLKVDEIHDRLLGIKGQYLLFESGVLNVRKYGGHEVVISY